MTPVNTALTAGDVGSRLRVAVTARNPGGSATAFSAQTAVVTSVKGKVCALALSPLSDLATGILPRAEPHVSGPGRRAASSGSW